jgi:hypothetical protein
MPTIIGIGLFKFLSYAYAYAVAYGGYVVAVASIAYTVRSNQIAKARMRAAARDAQGVTTMVRDAVAPMQTLYGERRTSGPMVFVHEFGTDRKYLYIVVPIAPHAVDAIKWVWFDEQVVEFNATTGAVTSGNYLGFASIWVQTGAAGSDAFAALRSELPSQWGSQHKLEGCAAICVRLTYDQNMFQTGIPNISVTTRGKKLYDPRDGTTHWSFNPALIAADILTDTYLGLGVPWSAINTAELIASANICDEYVACVAPAPTDATTFRYSCNYVANSSVLPENHLQAVAACMAGDIVRSSGQWFIRAGAHRTPTVEFTQSDLLGGITMLPRLPKRALCNRVRGIYVDIPTKYTSADFPPVKNATYLAQDGGEELWRDLDLPATCDPVVAQRLAKIELERTRQQVGFTAKFGLRALQVMPTDNITFTYDRFGWASKVFEVKAWRLEFSPTEGGGSQAFVEMELRETASSVYAWSAEETVKDDSPDTNLPSPFATPAAPTALTVTQVAQNSPAGDWQNGFELEWTAPADGYVQAGGAINIRYRRSGDADWVDAGSARGDSTKTFLTPPWYGISYEVQIQSENALGIKSAWVASSPATTLLAYDTTAPAWTWGSGNPRSPAEYPISPATETAATSYPYGFSMLIQPGFDGDLAYFEYSFKTGSTRWTAPSSGTFKSYDKAAIPVYLTSGQRAAMYETYPEGVVWARAVDTSGNIGDWASFGVSSTNRDKAQKLIGTVAAQDSTAANLSGLQQGAVGASSVRKVLARYQTEGYFAVTGEGANRGYGTVDLTNRGFSTAPDVGLIVKADNSTTQEGWSYSYIRSESSSTSAKWYVTAPTGVVIPNTYLIFSAEFIEYD